MFDVLAICPSEIGGFILCFSKQLTYISKIINNSYHYMEEVGGGGVNKEDRGLINLQNLMFKGQGGAC